MMSMPPNVGTSHSQTVGCNKERIILEEVLNQNKELPNEKPQESIWKAIGWWETRRIFLNFILILGIEISIQLIEWAVKLQTGEDAIEPDLDSDQNHLWAYLFDEFHQELAKGIVADYRSGITFMLRNGLKRVIGQMRVKL